MPPNTSRQPAHMYDVNLFLGTTAANAGNEHRYPAGERHPFLVFSRHPAVAMTKGRAPL